MIGRCRPKRCMGRTGYEEIAPIFISGRGETLKASEPRLWLMVPDAA